MAGLRILDPIERVTRLQGVTRMTIKCTLEQMTGFSLFALKAVLSGRGDEVIDLAKVNLLQRWFS